MYEIRVLPEPNPGVPSGGMRSAAETSSSLFTGEGKDARFFLSETGLSKGGCSSNPVDLRIAVTLGLGATTGGDCEEGEAPPGCHLSSTFLPPGADFSTGEGRLGMLPTSRSLLALIMLCTKPRPFNLLRLGVGSF